MSAILTFLGGSAFRAIWGEVAGWLNRRQEHKTEMQRMELQGKLDSAQHDRNMTAIRVQAELGVKTINVQADADVSRTEADAFREAMARAAIPTGITWIDSWNGAIRPAFATVALSLWGLSLHRASWALTEWDLSLIGAVAGYYFADRTLRKLKR